MRDLAFRFCLAGVLVTALGSATVLAASERTQAENLIVIVTNENESPFGAGIVFAVRPSRVYIVTARHVVHRWGEIIQGLRVSFRSSPGERLEANALNWDMNLDLAVLEVSREASGLSLDLLSDLAATLRLVSSSSVDESSRLYPLGHPEGDLWFSPAEPSEVYGISDELIELKFRCYPGHSGGGLFDSRWRLVGLTTKRKDARRCTGISFEKVRTQLEKWHREIDLEAVPREPCHPGPGPTAPWPECYVLGIAKFRECLQMKENRCDWPCVIDWMQKATRDATSMIGDGDREDVEEPIRESGVFYRRPTPYFFLGMAYYQSGDLARALEQWRESERQGLVHKDPDRLLALSALIDIAELGLEVEHTGGAAFNRDEVLVRPRDLKIRKKALKATSRRAQETLERLRTDEASAAKAKDSGQ